MPNQKKGANPTAGWPFSMDVYIEKGGLAFTIKDQRYERITAMFHFCNKTNVERIFDGIRGIKERRGLKRSAAA